mmetsp:Transcript_36332/g.100118  ORF Transcript_36332/g.100118 Transcript_36332/m.100118 type:complete len:293 (-) Transcript_36332:82-960(-)
MNSPKGLLRTSLEAGLDAESCRRRVARTLSSRTMDALIICLVLVDLACVSFEVGLDLKLICVGGQLVPVAPEELVRTSGSPAAFQQLFSHRVSGARRAIGEHGRVLGDASQHVGKHAVAGRVTGSLRLEPQETEEPEALVCEGENGPRAHELAHACHLASVAILVIFMVEIIAKLAVNPSEFCSNPYEILDLVVVTIALVLDTAGKSFAEMAAEVIIVCRFWRFVRILHGFLEIYDHEAEIIEELKDDLAKAEARCKELEQTRSRLSGQAEERRVESSRAAPTESSGGACPA